jgi:hypothetical protein
MRTRFTSMGIALLGLAASFAAAGPQIDLGKIDRTIRQEPHYAAKAKYCLLVFGPKAAMKVWLVQEGETIYVDRNGDGDLTEAGKAVRREPGDANGIEYRLGEIAGAAKKLTLRQYANIYILQAEFDSTHQQSAGMDATGQLNFTDSPKDAPVIHFGGPLTLRTNGQPLYRGEAMQLFVLVGTPGVGSGTFASISYDCIPANLHPMAEIQNTDDAVPPISPKKVQLESRC